jgi:hypothetical protein
MDERFAAAVESLHAKFDELKSGPSYRFGELSARLLALMDQLSDAAGAAVGTGVVQRGPEGELYVTALGLAIGEYVGRAGPEGPNAERRARIENLLIQIDERKLEVRHGPPQFRVKAREGPA